MGTILHSASINAAGTGYAATNILTLAGGTGTAATLEVDTVGGGGDILTFHIKTSGLYSVSPSSPNSPTGGAGSGASFNVTLEAFEQPLFIGPENYIAMACIRNLALGTEGTTFAAEVSDASGNMSANELLNEFLDTAWRSTSLAAFAGGSELELRWTFPAARTVDFVSAHRSNWRLPWRIKTYLSAALQSTSAWFDPIVREVPASDKQNPSLWTTGPTDDELDDLQLDFALDHFGLIPSISVDEVAIELDTSALDAGNNGIDYFQAGHVIIGELFQPAIGMLLDWTLGVVDLSTVFRADSGAQLGVSRSKLRQLAFALARLERTEAYTEILDRYMHKRGLLGRLFLVPEPLERLYFYNQAIVGTLENMPEVTMANLDWPAARGFVFTETE